MSPAYPGGPGGWARDGTTLHPKERLPIDPKPRRIAMSSAIAVHAIENLETWLGKDDRPAFFKQFCSSYRLYRLPDQGKVAVVWENADVAKLQKILADAKAEARAANKADMVLDSFEVFVEVEGAR
jgi:hypothetical protein